MTSSVSVLSFQLYKKNLFTDYSMKIFHFLNFDFILHQVKNNYMQKGILKCS